MLRSAKKQDLPDYGSLGASCSVSHLTTGLGEDLLIIPAVYESTRQQPLDPDDPTGIENPTKRLNWFLNHLTIDAAVAITIGW